MSSTSGFTPITFPQPRSIRQTLPRARRVMRLEWNKLFAEATEKDTKECVPFDDTGYDEHDCEDANESDYEETEENEEYEKNEDNEGNQEMPLNLCHKSKTVPVMSTHLENTDNSLDLTAEKESVKNHTEKHTEPKQNSCTVPNFQSDNYNNILPTKKNSCESYNFDGNQLFDTNENNENVGINKVINTGIRYINNNGDRIPMKSMNNVEANVMLEINKNPVGNEQPFTEKSLNDNHKNRSYDACYSSQNTLQNNHKNIENAYEKLIHDRSSDQPNGNQNRGLSTYSEKDHVRFAVPCVPDKMKSSGKTVVINGKSYQILAPLGKGGSSSVFLVLSTKNELLAVKCVKLSGVTESIKNDYLNEIQHLMRMQHSRHVIRLFDHQYIASHKLLYAVMEKGDTDLSRFLKDKAASEEGITPELILYYWNEMLLCVKSIHDNNIIHRDLKPANFLLVSGRLKLIDFGIASSIQNEQTSILMDTQSGTFNYMSPEALLDLGSGSEIVLKIGRKSDVWSLGCILYYFLYKKTPYQDIVKPMQKMRAITDPNYAVKFPKLNGVPDILIESCKKCLIYDRQKRASIEELLELRNRPLLTLSQVLTKLKRSLTDLEYSKAEKALTEEIQEENSV